MPQQSGKKFSDSPKGDQQDRFSARVCPDYIGMFMPLNKSCGVCLATKDVILWDVSTFSKSNCKNAERFK